ncbi:MAG: hypothetical protein HY225_00255 [Candidatus Vogelbacteria bacterium]|nr:hypothetical protein [Candidatus Vogelbacteria bacterium]
MNIYLQKRIMRRVYFMWVLRQILSAASIKVMIIFAFLWQIKHIVYVRSVIANMPSITDIVANINFFSAAFAHTHPSVQLSIIASSVVALWLLNDARHRELGYWF